MQLEVSTSALGFTMEPAKSGGGASASEPPARLLPGALCLVSREGVCPLPLASCPPSLCSTPPLFDGSPYFCFPTLLHLPGDSPLPQLSPAAAPLLTLINLKG